MHMPARGVADLDLRRFPPCHPLFMMILILVVKVDRLQAERSYTLEENLRE